MAREHLEQGIALYDPQQHRSLAFVYGMDIGVACRIYAAWILWLLGYPDQALKRSHEAITLAQELSHPYSLSFALDFAADLHQFRREGRLAQERAEAAMALSAEQGFAHASGAGQLSCGAGRWPSRDREKKELRRCARAWPPTGRRGQSWQRPYFLALLAEAYGKGGQVEEGLSVWPRRWLQWTKLGSVSTRRSCIG